VVFSILHALIFQHDLEYCIANSVQWNIFFKAVLSRSKVLYSIFVSNVGEIFYNCLCQKSIIPYSRNYLKMFCTPNFLSILLKALLIPNHPFNIISTYFKMFPRPLHERADTVLKFLFVKTVLVSLHAYEGVLIGLHVLLDVRFFKSTFISCENRQMLILELNRKKTNTQRLVKFMLQNKLIRKKNHGKKLASL